MQSQRPKPKQKKKKRVSKNDYCQHYVDKGERPGNFIRDIEDDVRFRDYPKLNELIDKKNILIRSRNPPPMYLKADLKKFDIRSLGQFDCILIDPPWEEYYRRVSHLGDVIDLEKFKPWSLDEIGALPID